MAFVLGKPFKLSKPGAYPRTKYFKGASLWQASTLVANVRLARKGLPWTNTLAYYEHSQITYVKSFITLGPGH